MAKRRSRIWQRIERQLGLLRTAISEQSFVIDIAYRIFLNLNAYTERADLRLNMIAAYWGLQMLKIWKGAGYPMEGKSVFIEAEYSSYLNLMMIAEEGAKVGFSPIIVDLVTDTTPIPEGEELDEWSLENDLFVDAMKELWETTLIPVWSAEGRLVDYKTTTFSHYYKYEDYIFTMTVSDYDLNPVVIFILGTYDQYM